MLSTGEKTDTDSKQKDNLSKQENQITFSSAQSLLRCLLLRSRIEAMGYSGWEFCTQNHTDLCSNSCCYHLTTSLALGKSFNLSELSFHLKMGITSPNSYGFRVSLMRQSIISMSGIQKMFHKWFLLFYYYLIIIFHL